MFLNIRHVLLLLCFGCMLKTNAQVTDNFSDGDFTNNPTWTGDVAKFIVNPAFQLQLNAPAATDTAVLVTPQTLVRNTEWRFWIRLGFSPSGFNQARLYLASSAPFLTGPLNGYYLQLGESGSADAVELYEQTGTNSTLILRGTNGTITATNNVLSFKVTCSATGQWQVWADFTGGNNYQLQGSGNGTAHTTSGYLGWLCKYTSSNSNRFWLDDVYAGPPIVDVTPPAIKDIQVLSAQTLKILFTEPVTAAAANPLLYNLSGGIGTAFSAIQDAVDPSIVTLVLNNSLLPNFSYTLTSGPFTDLSNNTSTVLSNVFVWSRPEKYDVVISEIFFNPTNSPALPNAEFVEITNRTALPVRLNNWKFKDASTTIGILPDSILLPNEKAILCQNSAAAAFAPYGKVIPLSAWPSLNNDGDLLHLFTPDSALIDYVGYADTWIQETFKRAGGWSLEKIDLNNVCAQKPNWGASKNPSGGTPGSINSINGTLVDDVAPLLVRLTLKLPDTITVFFSEPVDAGWAANKSKWKLLPGNVSPSTVGPLQPPFNTFWLKFSQPIVQNTVYTLVAEDLKDCAGNITIKDSLVFGVPQPIDSGDIVINEILFNPNTGGVDFVELYNTTTKVMDLKNHFIAQSDETGALLDPVNLAPDSYLMLPNAYVCVSIDENKVKAFYNTPNPLNFINTPTLPSFNNDQGTVVFHTISGNVLDQLTYNENWHNSLLDNVKGVSLERISPLAPTQNKNNWASAAKAVGYATPAYRNSQYAAETTPKEQVYTQKEVFTPNGDGQDDQSMLVYALEGSDWLANLTVFDASGRLIKQIAKAETIAPQGFYTWNGTDTNGALVANGVYIYLFEVWNAKGGRQIFKVPVALSQIR